PKSAETRRPARRGNIHDKHFSFSVCASSGNRKGKKCIGGLERALDSIKLPASRRQGGIDEELTPGQEEWVIDVAVTSHLSRTPGTPNCAGTPIDGRLLKAFLLRHVLEVVVSVNGCWRGGSGASKRARARVVIAELQMKAEVYELWGGNTAKIEGSAAVICGHRAPTGDRGAAMGDAIKITVTYMVKTLPIMSDRMHPYGGESFITSKISKGRLKRTYVNAT
ncbi:hypothetical protein C8R43DRAFT_966195, partial [Mycena crocata]